MKKAGLEIGFKTVVLEDEWKKYTGLANAHFVNSATSGLHLAVKILKDEFKWDEDSEVISTPLTFISTNHAIKYEGLHITFADVDKYLCLDPADVEKKINKNYQSCCVCGNCGKYRKSGESCQALRQA